MFSLNLLAMVSYIFIIDQCSSIFRRAWNANRSRYEALRGPTDVQVSTLLLHIQMDIGI